MAKKTNEAVEAKTAEVKEKKTSKKAAKNNYNKL